MRGQKNSIGGGIAWRGLAVAAALGLALALVAQPPRAAASHIPEEQAIAAFQALKNRVDTLEAENAAQQAEIDTLTALIQSLLPAPRTVFITSQAYAPVLDFAGLGDADAICQQHATDAGLPGTFKAWLSDELNSPSTRFTRSAGPYVLTDGTLVAAGWDDLVDCANPNCLFHAIDRDEYQAPAAGDYVWTGTTQAGETSIAEGTCVGWTSTDYGGAAGRVDSLGGWTSILYGRYCGLALHLYCFQQ